MKEVQICVSQVKGRCCSRESGSCQSNYSQQTGSKKLRDLKLTYSSEQTSRCSVCIHLYFSPLICCVFFPPNSASFSVHLSLTQTLKIDSANQKNKALTNKWDPLYLGVKSELSGFSSHLPLLVKTLNPQCSNSHRSWNASILLVKLWKLQHHLSSIHTVNVLHHFLKLCFLIFKRKYKKFNEMCLIVTVWCGLNWEPLLQLQNPVTIWVSNSQFTVKCLETTCNSVSVAKEIKSGKVDILH